MNVLDQDARVPRFGGLGFQVALLAPLRRGFFAGESRPIFLWDSGLWLTNLAPRVVRMIDAN